jgi:hypothetical protein
MLDVLIIDILSGLRYGDYVLSQAGKPTARGEPGLASLPQMN